MVVFRTLAFFLTAEILYFTLHLSKCLKNDLDVQCTNISSAFYYRLNEREIDTRNYKIYHEILYLHSRNSFTQSEEMQFRAGKCKDCVKASSIGTLLRMTFSYNVIAVVVKIIMKGELLNKNTQ